MSTKKAAPAKEKAAPLRCVCGRPAALVKSGGGKMVSCPNPEKCNGNLRTLWYRHQDEAVASWNRLVAAEKNRLKEELNV